MRTVIYGNGAMARVLFSYARHELDIAGFTVDDAFCGAPNFCDLPLVPFSAVDSVFPPATHNMITAIGYLDMNRLRERKYDEARARGYGFERYIHASVIRHDGVTIEDNAVVLDHVSIHPDCRIGRGSFISSNTNIGHGCDIGDWTWINSGVAIAGGCQIGSGCVFGINASAARGVSVGARNFIGANTLIHRATKPGEVYLSEAGTVFRLGSDDFLQFSRQS